MFRFQGPAAVKPQEKNLKELKKELEDLLNYRVAEYIICPKSYYDNRQRSFNCYNANYNCYFLLG